MTKRYYISIYLKYYSEVPGRDFQLWTSLTPRTTWRARDTVGNPEAIALGKRLKSGVASGRVGGEAGMCPQGESFFLRFLWRPPLRVTYIELHLLLNPPS